MSEKTTLTCDVCGKDRAEVNGWWSYWTDGRGFHVAHADGKKGRSHACGHLCVHKALDTFLTTQTVHPAAPILEIPQDEPKPTSNGEPESLVKGKGLTVEGLVELTGGNPDKAVYEGSVSVEIDGEKRLVATQDTLPCEPGEGTAPVDALQVENQPEVKSN
jgi:hypothetical protein